MHPIIVREKISQEVITRMALENFGDIVKVDVDIERGILTLGGDWHSEGQQLLVEDGSSGLNVWGVNFYPWKPSQERIAYVSLINLKSHLKHENMEIKDVELKKKIKKIINDLLLDDNETLPS